MSLSGAQVELGSAVIVVGHDRGDTRCPYRVGHTDRECYILHGAFKGCPVPERTPEGHPQLWLLYRPEPWCDDGVWMRRCEAFSTEGNAKGYLNTMLNVPEGQSLVWRQHPLFPELQYATNERGWRWYLTFAPLDPPAGRVKPLR